MKTLAFFILTLFHFTVTSQILDDTIVNIHKQNLDTESENLLLDKRDGKTYKTVKIGNQIWMAENLNFKTISGNWCYEDLNYYCDTYGRLYNWETAMYVCPNGWHLPSKEEMEILLANVDSIDTYASLLPKGNSGFDNILSGRFFKSYGFTGIGFESGYWTSSTHNDKTAWLLYITVGKNTNFSGTSNTTDWGYSVRCLKN